MLLSFQIMSKKINGICFMFHYLTQKRFFDIIYFNCFFLFLTFTNENYLSFEFFKKFKKEIINPLNFF